MYAAPSTFKSADTHGRDELRPQMICSPYFVRVMSVEIGEDEECKEPAPCGDRRTEDFGPRERDSLMRTTIVCERGVVQAQKLACTVGDLFTAHVVMKRPEAKRHDEHVKRQHSGSAPHQFWAGVDDMKTSRQCASAAGLKMLAIGVRAALLAEDAGGGRDGRIHVPGLVGAQDASRTKAPSAAHRLGNSQAPSRQRRIGASQRNMPAAAGPRSTLRQAGIGYRPIGAATRTRTSREQNREDSF
jgi:hypothetical protein